MASTGTGSRGNKTRFQVERHSHQSHYHKSNEKDEGDQPVFKKIFYKSVEHDERYLTGSASDEAEA